MLKKKKKIVIQPKEEDLLIKTEEAPDMVNKPPHYRREGAIECLDEMELVFGTESLYIFCVLNAYKYRYRCLDKGKPTEDMAKSDFYMRKAMELSKEIYDDTPGSDDNLKLN